MLSDTDCESDDGNHSTNVGPFMCELCYRDNVNTTAIFKECFHLMVHTRKKHSTTCVGCYEELGSVDAMKEHVRSGAHPTLLICHECLTLFPVESELSAHDCTVKPEKVEDSGMQVEGGDDTECFPLHADVKSEEAEGKDEESIGSGSVCTDIESGESDVEEDNESGPFLCDLCDVGDGKSSFVFKHRDHLVRHLMKRHPGVCPGCFLQFNDVEEMREHMRCEDHDLPVCCACWTVFSDKTEKGKHICKEGREEWSKPRPFRHVAPTRPSNVRIKVEAVSESEASDAESDNDSSCAEDYEHEVVEDDQVSCLYCPSLPSASQPELRSHTYQEHETVCCVCFEELEDKEALERHQASMNHHVWFDERCKRVFIRRSVYRSHVSTFHRQDCPFTCPYCDKFATWYETRLQNEHIPSMHPEYKTTTARNRQGTKLSWHVSRTVCGLCKEDLHTAYSLLLHMYECHNEPGLTHIFKCESCNVGFGKGKLFESHLKNYHADETEYLEEARLVVEQIYQKPSTCNVCGKSFQKTSSLTRHFNEKHRDLKPHKCKICGDHFTQESDLRVHHARNHNGPWYIECPECGLSHTTLYHLEKHLIKQHGGKMLPLAYCFTHERSFYNDHTFQGHYEVLHGKKPRWDPSDYGTFPCNICDKVFVLERYLKNHHVRVHQPREKLKCDVCGLTFKGMYIHSHMQKHTGANKCSVCGKTFESKLNLRRHAVVHSGEKPFACDLCGLRVSQKSALQRHVKVVHPDGKVKANARAPSFRRTRGPLTKQRYGSVAVAPPNKPCEDVGDEEKAVAVNPPKGRRKGSVKRRRETSSSSDSDAGMNGVSERSIDSVETNEAAARKPERKRRRVAMKSYREPSSSDGGVEEEEVEVDLDASPPKTTSNPRKPRKKVPALKRKRGRPSRKK